MNATNVLLQGAVLLALGTSGAAYAANPAVDRALRLLRQHSQTVAPPPRTAASAGTRTDTEQYSVRDVIVDADGTEHVRFDRSYRGLPVIHGDVVVHSRQGRLQSLSLTQQPSLRLDNLKARLRADQAIVEAALHYDGKFELMPTARQVIHAGDGTPRLAYEVAFPGSSRSGEPSHELIYVAADNGEFLGRTNLIQSVSGTGHSLFLGDVPLDTTPGGLFGGYRLIDPLRGNGSVANGNGYTLTILDILLGTPGLLFQPMTDADNVWGNNQETDVASSAADAAYGIAATWDYYKTNFNRTGIFNDGKGVKSVVNVLFNPLIVTQPGTNAAWNQLHKQMYYGMAGTVGPYQVYPLVAVDIAGHEMSHGVNQATANLAYSGDAGGLNEGNSDIHGTLVEFAVDKPGDPPDYTIGERIFRDGTTALRYMFKPSLDAYLHTSTGRKSYDCYPAGGFDPNNTDEHDPHYTSGVANHFFYLLAEGATVPAGYALDKNDLVCNGNTNLVGIGRAKAGQIWYRGHTVYMTSNTSYPQARAATLQAAADLYGPASAERAAVAAAWSAVNVD